MREGAKEGREMLERTIEIHLHDSVQQAGIFQFEQSRSDRHTSVHVKHVNAAEFCN